MRQLLDPGLFVVMDRDDTPERNEYLRALAAAEPERLLVTITPGSDNNRSVGNDILKSLGKDPELHGAGRNSTETWQRAMVWLELAGVGDLFVSRAHLLPFWLLEDMVRLSARAGTRLWLIFQTPVLRRNHQRFLRLWPATELEWEGFQTRWGIPRKRLQEKRAKHRETVKLLPHVPVDDFTTFRASCRALLSADDFAAVDAEFIDAFQTSSKYFQDKSSEDVTEEDICTHVREVIAEVVWMPSLVTKIRGSQVAAFRAGHLVKVNLDGLMSTRVSRVRLDDDAIERLARYATPRLAAAAVLEAATGAQLKDIIAINIDDVGVDGSEVIVAGLTHRLPAKAAQMVEALVRERMMRGAGADDPLFVYVQGTGRRHGELVRWTVRGMFDNLKKVERETGLLLTAHLRDHGNRNAVAWAHRRGISIQRI